MLIVDLPHVENLKKDREVVGGTSLGLTAVAFSTGDTTYTLADTNVSLRTVGHGRVTIGKGRGTALAYGNDPYAFTGYEAQGFNKTIVNSRSSKSQVFASSSLQVIALALPTRKSR